MEDEIQALQKNDTRRKYEISRGRTVVGCIWMFSIKYKADGTLEAYKAHLMEKGYMQTYGIDKLLKFSPTTKIDTIRVLLSLVANNDWPLHQFDVKKCVPSW